MEHIESITMEALTLEIAKDGSGYTLISCDPTAVNVEIPSEVKVIAKGAFDGCSKLKNLIVSDGVERIECGALEGCSSLKSITLPFIGESRNAKGYKAHLGYIFGVKAYENPSFFSDRAKINWSYDDGKMLYDYPIPESLANVIVSESCESLPNYAFYKCYYIESITLPAEMSRMGDQPFSLCKKLREIIIPEGITEIGAYCFSGCGGLKRAVIPASVTRIGEYAFPRSGNKVEIIVDSESVSVGERAFACSSISRLVMKGEIKPAVKKGANPTEHIATVFDNCSVYRAEISTSVIPYIAGRGTHELTIVGGDIAADAFYASDVLETLVIGEGVARIGDRAFMGCERLTNLTLAEGVESIGDHAFDQCVEVEKLVVPDSTRSIGSYAFCGCVGLLSVVLGAGVASIGDHAFDLCRSLTEVINFSPLAIGAGSTENGGVAAFALVVRGAGESFDSKEVHSAKSQIFENEGFVFNEVDGEYYLIGFNNWGCDAILPTSCNGKPYKISKSAFESDKNISRLIILGGVTEIGERAFACCKYLKSVEIVDGLERIGNAAFCECSELKSVYINRGIESVGAEAFERCNTYLRICVRERKRPRGWSKHWAPKKTHVVWKYDPKKDKLANWRAVPCGK